MMGFNYKKAVQTLNFFAQKEGGKIDKMKVIKLIWLSDRLHLRRYARPLNVDKYFALKFGPIQSNTADLAKNEDEFFSEEEKQYRDTYVTADDDRHLIVAKTKVDIGEFSNSDIEVMDMIYNNFGKLTSSQLSKISHAYPEWQKFETQLNAGEGSRFEMDFMDFFENPQGMKNDFFAQFGTQDTKAVFAETITC